jgi:hypothetical protein
VEIHIQVLKVLPNALLQSSPKQRFMLTEGAHLCLSPSLEYVMEGLKVQLLSIKQENELFFSTNACVLVRGVIICFL